MENVTLNDLLYVLLICVGPLALRFFYQLVRTKVENSHYAEAVAAIFDSVMFVNQTFVDELKAHGNFDAEARVTAFEKAKNAALDIMRESTYRWLERAYLDLDSWFEVQIEKAVKEAKNQSGAVA